MTTLFGQHGPAAVAVRGTTRVLLAADGRGRQHRSYRPYPSTNFTKMWFVNVTHHSLILQLRNQNSQVFPQTMFAINCWPVDLQPNRLTRRCSDCFSYARRFSISDYFFINFQLWVISRVVDARRRHPDEFQYYSRSCGLTVMKTVKWRRSSKLQDLDHLK